MKQVAQQFVNHAKQKFIAETIKKLSSINASLAEIGVYFGGTGTIIADNEYNNQIYLFDTFEGMPFSCEEDNYHKVGDFIDVVPVYNEILNHFQKYKNVKVYKGIFPIDTGHYIKDNEMFKFVHIDVDVYQSYQLSLNFFYDRMVKGGIMLFDDYDAPTCLGAKKACDEFFENKPENIIKINESYLIEKL